MPHQSSPSLARQSSGTASIPLLLALILAPIGIMEAASTVSLSSSGSGAPGANVSLTLSILNSAGSSPTALQWKVSYPGSDLAFVSASASTQSAAGGKLVLCYPSGGGQSCVLYGNNQTVLDSGAVATLVFRVSAGTVASSIAVSATGILLSDSAGLAVSSPSTTTSATIGVIQPAPVLSSLSCSPAQIPAGSAAACTVGLSLAAPAGGFNVAISKTSTSLTTPTSVSVPAGAMTATFQVTAGSVTADQSVVLTAVAAGVSKTFGLTIIAAPQLLSLACSPAGIMPAQTTQCTVTLSKAASSNYAVSISRNNSALAVPSSVTVPPGATSANFNGTGQAVTSITGVTVTATAGGVSRTATVTVSPVVQLSSLTCTPASIASQGSSTCTVGITGAAPVGGFAVGLSSASGTVVVPSGISVPSGATQASFQAKAGTVSTNQSVVITATGGGQSRSFSLTVTGSAQVLSLACSPNVLDYGQYTTCTVDLGNVTSTAAVVSLSSSQTFMPLPSSVTVLAGQRSTSFGAQAKAALATSQAILTASANGRTGTASVTVNQVVRVRTFACSPAQVVPGASSTCTLTFTAAAPASGLNVTLSSSSAHVTVPAGLTVSAGQETATFQAKAAAGVSTEQTASLKAVAGGAGSFFTLTVQPGAALLSSRIGIYRSGEFATDNGNLRWDGVGPDTYTYFGQAGDLPLVGDWDGDGKESLAVYRNGLWLIDWNQNGQFDGSTTDRVAYFGGAGYTPVAGDWNGDGKDEIGIFRDGLWYLDANGNLLPDGGDVLAYFGEAGALPVVGRWDGTTKTRIGVYRPSDGTWYLDLNGDYGYQASSDRSGTFGLPNSVPLVGDWTGDGRDRIGTYRAGVWTLDLDGNCQWSASVDRSGNFASTLPNALPVLGDWTGTGKTQAGVYFDGMWLLDLDGDLVWNQSKDGTGWFGLTGDQPLTGKWPR